MNARTTHDQLVRLLDVIIEERECAKKLDIEGLSEVMREKEELVQALTHVRKIDAEDLPIAARIRHENRRNAYLFKSTLGWIREIMEFFGRKTVTSTYSASAASVASHIYGRLLSGKV